MRIEQIVQFISITHYGNLSKVAEKLCVSEPYLSLSLKRLEQEVKHQLFVRVPTGLYLTPFGKEYYRYAKNLCEEWAKMEQFCNQTRDVRENFCVTVLNQYWINVLFAQFVQKKMNEKISFCLMEKNSLNGVIHSLLSGKSHIGFIHVTREEAQSVKQVLLRKKIEVHILSKSTLSLLIGKHNIYYNSGLSSVSCEMMSSVPFVVVGEPGLATHTSLSVATGLIGPETQLIRVNNFAAMYEMLENSRAVAISPTAQHFSYLIPQNLGVKAFSVDGCSQTFTTCVVKVKGRVISPLTKEFVESLGFNVNDW